MTQHSVDRHDVGRAMTDTRQRTMFFELGSAITNSRRVKVGHCNEDYGHELALMTLVATDFRSMRSAKAMATTMKYWG